MKHIFISYSRKDQEYAIKLSAELRKRNFTVWIDGDIPQGTRWFTEITKAIVECMAIIVIMTPDAEASEWVEQEIMLARNEKKLIIPLLLRGRCLPILINRQHIDVTSGDLPSDDFYGRLPNSQSEKNLLRNSTVLENTMVDEIMNTRFVLLHLDTITSNALSILKDMNERIAAVVNRDGQFVGVVTLWDIMQTVDENKGQTSLDVLMESIMVRDPIMLTLGTPVSDAIAIMSKWRKHYIFIVDSNLLPVGLISDLDILRYKDHFNLPASE